MKILFALLLPAMAASAAAPRGEQAYQKRVLPLLQKFCYDCHSDGVEKGNFVMDGHKDYTSLIADKMQWDHVRQQIATHVMPPEKKDKPSLAERDELLAWIDDTVFWFDPSKPDPGRAVWRRLNRTEYNNTIRDLLMVDIRPANEFPLDDTGYGYDNIGDVLALSPLLMEKYMRAANSITEKALDTSEAQRVDLEIGAKNFWNQKGNSSEHEGVRWFHNESEAATKFNAPASGTYIFRIKASATQAGTDAAKIAFGIDGKESGQFDVTARFRDEKGPWQTITHEVRLGGGEHLLSVKFLNDYYDGSNPDPEKRDRNLAVGKIDVEGPLGLLPPRGTRLVQWLLEGKPAGKPGIKLSGENFEIGDGAGGRDTGAIYLASSGFVKRAVEIEKAGKYRLTVKAGAQQAGSEPAKFDVRLGGKNAGSFSVTAKDQAPQWFNAEVELPVGRQEIQVWFLNDFYDEKTRQDRNFWLHELAVTGPMNESGGIAASDMPKLIQKLGTRLFRRPMKPEEQAKWVGVAELAQKQGASPFDAVGFVLRGMLVSPSFLFRAPPQLIGGVKDGSGLIDEHSLASRLSYFIWSGPPDDKLLQLAAKGELRQNLGTEVKRMLADWRAYSLAEDFAGQWLQLRDVEIADVDLRQFPEFKDGIASSMKRETQLFFNHLLRENRPVIELLSADYSFLNEKLARYYDIKGVKGDKHQKVSLQGTPRGGLLTHGSLLLVTSNPTRTSPVKRGKFLLENILGTPPPPAPGGVAPLDEKKARLGNLTLRQQFAEHRSHASCAGCHAFLDPLGFAFENYDAVGRWRTEEKKQPIDASGRLVRGQAFNNLAELRAILVRDMAGQFTKNLVENLMTYALGRGLEFSDKPNVQAVLKQSEASGHRFQDLIVAICQSVPMQRMRVD